jgi:hypothetical protein
MAKGGKEITVRSSAAEYLTFVAATGDNPAAVEMRYQDENIWLTQKMMAVLYDVSVPAISQHLKRIYSDNELEREATVKKYLIVQNEGGRSVSREVEHYNLQAIIAVGFKVENERAVQFRKWANAIVKDYTIQGWVMDVDRLKNNGSILTKEYFEKQLEKVREVRLFWIMIPQPPRQNDFLPPFRTKCTMPCTGIQRRKLLWHEQVTKKNIWD